MVVDAGGGTVDTTVHQCQRLGGQMVLSEVVAADGDCCGAVMVDEQMMGYYRDVVGPEQYDEWEKTCAGEVQDLLGRCVWHGICASMWAHIAVIMKQAGDAQILS